MNNLEEIKQIANGLHIAIIMDGNGRWAKQKGKSRSAGHVQGAKVFQDISEYGNELGLYALTFYAFSTENWARPQSEVKRLMAILKEYLHKAYDYEKENNKICILGDKTPFEAEMKDIMYDLEEKTKNRTGMILNIAINYGGRDEIVNAVKKIVLDVQNDKIQEEKISEDLFSSYLYTAGQKDPDIILRPSGEKRLSNFLLWQSAYAEYIGMNLLWPDFKRADLNNAILEYAGRSRRFGKV